jgi:hypothetical protein
MIAALAGRKAGPKRKCSLDAEKLHAADVAQQTAGVGGCD